MIAKASPLQILDFAVTRMEYELVPPQEMNDNIGKYFDQYEVEVDFELDIDDYLKVYITAKVNKTEEKQLPGYSILTEAACIFRFKDGNNLAEDIKRNLQGFSTIYIALNSLRGLISSFTANAPFGRYILPSIDLNDLIEKKRATAAKDVSKKVPAKKRAKTAKSE